MSKPSDLDNANYESEATLDAMTDATDEVEDEDTDDEDAWWNRPVPTEAYTAAEHRAQIRTVNAGQGVTRVSELVQRGIYGPEVLAANEAELAAAQNALRAIHQTPIGYDPVAYGLTPEVVSRIVQAVRNPETVAPRNGHKESDEEWAERVVRYVLADAERAAQTNDR